MRSSASVDFLVGGLATLLGQADVGEVGELEARQDLERDLEGEVALGVERLLDLAWSLGNSTCGSRASLRPLSATILRFASLTAFCTTSAITERP